MTETAALRPAAPQRRQAPDLAPLYGPLAPLLADRTISEVMVNGPDFIWIERDGKLHPTDLRFPSEEHLYRLVDAIAASVNRQVDQRAPMLDARLPDGSRVNAVVPPLTLSGPLLTIRKFDRSRFDLADLTESGTLSEAATAFLVTAVRARLSILVSGGTGSGKTTLLNGLSSAVPASERIVTIEDAAELHLRQAHVVRLEARPGQPGLEPITVRDLVRNALRMRPDRIIIGEVRGNEAVDMLQAMNTGHAGSLSTVHASSPAEALRRIETMVLMSNLELPLGAIREQMASAIDLIVQLDRGEDGARRVRTISEIVGIEDGEIVLQELFDRVVDDTLASTGMVPHFLSGRRGADTSPHFEQTAPWRDEWLSTYGEDHAMPSATPFGKNVVNPIRRRV